MKKTIFHFLHWPAAGMAVLLFSALLTSNAHAALTNSVPFFDDFESYPLGTPLINGTNGWYASDTNVIVQNSIFHSGSQAALIAYDSFLTNRFDPTATVNTSVWIELYMDAAALESASEPAMEAGVAASFYLNSNGHFVARNGTNWVTLPTTLFGEVLTFSGRWVKVNCFLDYQNAKWWLFADNRPMADNFDFADETVAALSAMDFYNGASTSYLDDVTVTGTVSAALTNLVTLQTSVTSIYRSVREGNDAESAVFEILNSQRKVDGSYFPLCYTNTVNYQGSASNWLTISAVTGTVYGEPSGITVTFNTAGLPVSPTPYTATIRINATDGEFGWPAAASPQEIAIELWVRSAPLLWVNPLELHPHANWGGTATPDELRIANSSAPPCDAMGYNISVSTANGGDWLRATPVSGVSTGETDVISIAYLSSTLDGGIYTGAVTVTSEGASGSPITVPVYLSVNHAPVLAWDMDTIDPDLNVSVQEGEAADDRYFHVWNASATPRGTMRFQVYLSDDLRQWVAAVTPATGVSSGETCRLTVQYNTTGMPAGVYSGTLTVRGVDEWSGICIGELSTNLTLRVVGRAALRVSTNQLAATVLENLTTNAAIRIWNGGGEPRRAMCYQIMPQATWLSAVPSSGTINNGDTSTVTTAFNSGSLAAGNYQGEIIVDAWDAVDGMRAIGAPLALPVTLTVESRTPYNYEPPEIIGTPYVGQTLSAWPGLWRHMDRLTFEYQWERATTSNGVGAATIQAWSSSTNYQVTAADRGKYLRVLVRATDSAPTPLSATAASNYRQGKVIPVPADFDGDGRTDLWFFDPSCGTWHASLSSGLEGSVVFGSAGMAAVPGDYDGNGYLDLALYDQANGVWHAMLLPQWQYASGRFGWAQAVAAPGDYNGDGTTDLCVYWAQAGRWYIYYVNIWSLEEIALGGPNYAALPADYDGDRITDPAVYSAASGQWIIRGSRDGLWEAQLGGTGALGAPFDYDGDGKADVAVYWQTSNLWQIRSSATGLINQEQFGVSNGYGIPLPGYYDRDGLGDPAHAHLSGDFILWSVRLTSLTNYFQYRGQSYQISTDFWRVSW